MTIPRYIRNAWNHMKHRCYNKRYQNYKWYGARGIRMCDRWRDSCEAFYEDIGDRPSTDHSLDRIDNNGHYTPENCRWATQSQQVRNSRLANNLTVDGVTKCISQWADEIGISTAALRQRIRRHGVEIAILSPKCRSRGEHIKPQITKRGPKWKASPFRGVGKQQDGWQAQLKYKGELLYRKYYKCQLTAAIAVDDAAYRHFGERALLNFPERKRNSK